MTEELIASSLRQAPVIGLMLASLVVVVGVMLKVIRELREWSSYEREQNHRALARTVDAHADALRGMAETLAGAMDRLTSQSERTHEDTRSLLAIIRAERRP